MKIQSIENSFFATKTQKSNIPKQIKPENFQNSTSCQNYFSNLISFQGINAKGIVQQRGMLMHITSLPAHRSFCGQFGDIQTTKFINWLKSAKQTHWIMNPLNALTDDLCPYNASGRFSRNKFIVNLNKLTGKEYGEILKEHELPEDISSPTFTLEMLEKQKNPRFKIAYERFKKLDNNTPIKKEYTKFLEENNNLWLEDYAHYDALSRIFGTNWLNWDKRLQTAPEDSKKEGVTLENHILKILKDINKRQSAKQYKDSIGLYKFEQFLYDKQFSEMVEELRENGIKLILDLPIGISPAGADTWSKKNIFLLDKNFKPIKVSGCPSEGAYGYTQVWGHALYDYDSPEFWDYQEASLHQLLKNADLRLDHFVGYVNRATIPTTYTKKDGTILKDGEIFNPKSMGGMGTGFFKKEWIEIIDSKRSPKGENVFELFIRVANELGKIPEDTYILESFGPLAKTPAYQKFEKEYGKNFISQRIPIGMGLGESDKELQKLNSIEDSSNIQNLAYLTGNHDLPSLREFIDNLLESTQKTKNQFLDFCKTQLKLNKREIQNTETIWKNAMKWHYSRNVKQVQTTIQDALGIYWRPNIPGSWNGMHDKYLMKATPEALTPFWNRVFPKDFLERDNINGINPGYKKAANRFVNMMKKLYPDK